MKNQFDGCCILLIIMFLTNSIRRSRRRADFGFLIPSLFGLVTKVTFYRLAVTVSSGPGFVLKQEALGLATMVELPIVAVNVQRAGPATGSPTKTEQGDLLMALHGRHSQSPIEYLTKSREQVSRKSENGKIPVNTACKPRFMLRRLRRKSRRRCPVTQCHKGINNPSAQSIAQI